MSLFASGRQCASSVANSKLRLRICSSLSTCLKQQYTSIVVSSHCFTYPSMFICQSYCATASIYHLLHSHLQRSFHQRSHLETQNYLGHIHQAKLETMTDIQLMLQPVSTTRLLPAILKVSFSLASIRDVLRGPGSLPKRKMLIRGCGT